jgi:GAF domain-containing protein
MPHFVTDMHLAVLSGIDSSDAVRFERDWHAGTRRLEAFSFEVRLTALGGARWHELRAVPNFHDGHLRKWIVELADIDESIAMRQALLRSRRRLNALADTGRVLVDVTSSSCAFMQGIVQIAASTLAATCIAVYGDEDGEQPCVIVHPPEGQHLVSKLAELDAKPAEAFVIPMQAHWEGEAVRPVLIASLGTHGRQQNALFAIGAPGAQPFEEDDAALLGEMGKRLGAALRGAAAYRRERRVAHVLQRAMLPVALPRPPGITFDVTYRASDDIAVVGGDWYDAFEIADGKIAVLIGDVAGHGLDAAVVMGCVREGIRTTALDGACPGEVLMRVNRTVLAGRNVMVTAFVGLLDPVTLTLHYANAGHPPPLVVAKEGISSLEFGDVALGVDVQAEYGTRTINLADAQALVLFTDGLIEFERNVVMGERRLRDVLETWAGSGFSGGAEHLADATLGECLPRDDIALLVVRLEQAARLDAMVASTHHETQRARLGGETSRRSFPRIGVPVYMGQERSKSAGNESLFSDHETGISCTP